jgi:hypothetical protein
MAESPGPRGFTGASTLVAATNALFRRERDRRGCRSAEQDRPAPPLEFDATITLHDHLREGGLGDHRADDALAAVRAAVRSMPGAGWIGAEYVGPSWAEGWAWMRRAEWVTVYRRWDAVPPRGSEWERLRGSVEEMVRRAAGGGRVTIALSSWTVWSGAGCSRPRRACCGRRGRVSECLSGPLSLFTRDRKKRL